MKLLVLLACLVCLAYCHEPFQVMFQWNIVEVNFPNEEERAHAYKHGGYVPANNPIAGIKFWRGKMYLTIPRWRSGVPVTLAVTNAMPANNDTAPKLDAFPSWEMQKVGDCNAFQFVQSMEIDPQGRMWVLDTGRTETRTLQAKNRCPPRLVILDLEKGGAVLRSYRFPATVTPPESSYLNDIVLDHEEGGLAYISDNGSDDPGLIVFSLRNNTSWKIRHESMKAKYEAVNFVVNKTPVIMPIHIDGIALSPASARSNGSIYYSPLSSFNLYSLPLWVVRNQNMSSNVDRYVQDLGRKNSQTDGMMMSSKGVLYFGLLADDAVATWDTKRSFSTGQRVISRDHALMQWPDTFAFDEDGSFWCVTNALQNFLVSRVDITAPNYRVLKMRTDSKSYQYLENQEAPTLPVITAAANAATFALSTFVSILLLYIFV